MSDQLRRRASRQPSDWSGFYRFDDADDERLRSCRVLYASPFGAELELFGTTSGEPLEERITFALELHGESRNARRLNAHSARIEVEFTESAGAENRYLRTMNAVRSRW